MTERTKEIASQILRTLSGWDDPAREAVIYAQIVSRMPSLLMSEFDDAISACQEEHWITGENDKLKGRVWSITNKGQAARRK